MVSTITKFYAETKPIYDKRGRLRIETTVRAIERDVFTGRIVKSTSGRFWNQQQVSNFLAQVNSGELQGSKAFGILKSRGKRSRPELVKAGYRSLINMFEDKLPVSDYQMDKLAYMSTKMEWEDFEQFYKENSQLIEKTYRIGSPRARAGDQNIINPTEYEYQNTIGTLLDNMQEFLGISAEEMDNAVPKKNYKPNGVRKSSIKTPKFSKFFYNSESV